MTNNYFDESFPLFAFFVIGCKGIFYLVIFIACLKYVVY